jgi:1-acyl-sn-glycerol-3-phosphate acyltransferase
MPERIEYVRPAPIHRPGILGVVAGVVRFALVLPALVMGALIVVLASLLPMRIRGVRPALWVVVGLCRVFVRLFGIRLRCTDRAALRRHAGLVFINHLSYLDPILIEAVTPVRFLSTAGVRGLPFVGWIAQSIGTVFVDRSDESSRAASREVLVGKLRARAFPPIALAPEGQIGPGDAVLPFRHGAFEVAAEAGVPILPVVLQMDPLNAAAWVHGEWILRALWRLAARTTPFTATVTPLPCIHPTPDEDIEALAARTEAAFDAVLRS